MELVEVEIIKTELPGKQEGGFFPLQKITHFYSQRKTDISDTVETVLGAEIWDRSAHTVISMPGKMVLGSKDHCVSLEMTPPGQSHP